MRLLFLFLSLTTIACTNRNNQPNKPGDTTRQNTVQITSTLPAPDSMSTDSAIARIRAAFQQINTASLKSQEFKWEAVNCNNDGTATYYLTNKNEIVKVVETGAIGDGSWTTAYYYQEGRFIFSLETDIGGPANGPVDTITIRKYVYADKVIRSISNKPYTCYGGWCTNSGIERIQDSRSLQEQRLWGLLFANKSISLFLGILHFLQPAVVFYPCIEEENTKSK